MRVFVRAEYVCGKCGMAVIGRPVPPSRPRTEWPVFCSNDECEDYGKTFRLKMPYIDAEEMPWPPLKP